METISEARCFGGTQGVYRHDSEAVGGPMELAVYLPPQAASGPVPIVTYLSGLTCTWENFTVKAGAQRFAAAHGLALVAPDTSPRGSDLPGEHDDWDFGSGAGFYVDATRAPWSDRYRMWSYVTEELPALVERHFPVDPERQGIFGHSMGGHGALVAALRMPERYRSLSAFAPIVAPSSCPWGEKAFSGYLGDDRDAWSAYDATALVGARGWPHGTILIDQGTADGFLEEQLRPRLFLEAARAAGVPVELRMQSGYDHSYWFITTFIADHLAHHASELTTRPS